MILEQRTYTLHPHVPMQEFLQAYADLGLPTQRKVLGGFLGYFTNEFGTQNQVDHFWAFTDLEERRRLRAALAEEPQWQECITHVRPMIAAMQNKILTPTEFSPIRSLPVHCYEPQTAFDFPA